MKRLTIILLAVLGGCFACRAQELVLTLEGCKELARDNDPYLKNARLDALSARAQKSEALAEYFPTVQATVMGFHALNPLIDIGIVDILGRSDAAWNISNAYDDFAYSNGLPDRYRALQYGYGAGVSVMQPLFAGGRIVSGNRLAELGVRAADLKSSLQARETDSGVERKFWQVVSLVEKMKVLDAAMEMVDSLEKDVESAYSAGLVTEADKLQLKLKKSELKSARLQLLGGIRLAKMDMFNEIGIAYSAVSSASSADRPYIDAVSFDSGTDELRSPQSVRISEEEMAASMEEARLLDLQVEAKKLEKRMVLGSTLPQVALGGVYGYGHYVGDGKLNGTVFAMVSVPISDWGKTSRRLKRYENEVQKAENEREYLDSQLLLRARQMWIELETSWERMAVACEASDLARDSFARQRAAYDAGMATMSELLQSQTDLLSCEESCAESRIAYRMALDSYLAFR